MPVLGEHNVLEAARELIDQRHDLIARWHGKVSAGTDVVLNIDYDQDIAVCYCVHASTQFDLCVE